MWKLIIEKEKCNFIHEKSTFITFENDTSLTFIKQAKVLIDHSVSLSDWKLEKYNCAISPF